MASVLSRPLPIRVAVLDLYRGKPNQGIRALQALLSAGEQAYGAPFRVDVFDVRAKAEVPPPSYDVYISSGGPGSPFDGQGTRWEARYFAWMDAVWNHNARAAAPSIQHVLCICHSFQMMCRHFALGDVTRRSVRSFGVFPVHRTAAGHTEPLFHRLPDPFYVADFRHWQVTGPRTARLRELGASVVALEQPGAHPVRALMGIRLAPEWLGVQFHPEADPRGMHAHLSQPERRRHVVAELGEATYQRALERLRDPSYLERTHQTIVPTFLRRAVAQLRPSASRTAA